MEPNSNDDITVWNERGWLYFDQRQYHQSIGAFDKVLATDATNKEALGGKIAALVQLAWSQYDQQQYDQAIETFDEVLGIDENNEYALKWKITSLRRQSRFEQAERTMEEALKRLPNSALILNERGWLRYDQQQYDQAIETFDQILAVDENNEDALQGKIASLQELGWLHAEEQQYGRAVTTFDQILAVDENNEDALQGKIAALRAQRQFEEAERAIREALERLPDNVLVLNEQGWLHYDQQQYGRAVTTFDQILAIDGTNELALQGALQGKIASLRGQWQFEEAERAIREALERLPDNVLVLNEQGWLHYDQQQYGQAVATFERVLDIDPENKDALRWKIMSLSLQRRFDEADRVVRQALARLSENNIAILIECGWVHFDQRQYDQAIVAFDEVLAIDATNEAALQGKITSLRFQRQFGKADRAIREALMLLPDNVSILNERGWLHFDRDQFEQADACFSEAIKLDPGWIQPYFNRVTALMRLHRNHEALEILQQLKESFPDSLWVNDHFGWFCIERNDLTRAEKEFQQILEKDNNNIFGNYGLGVVYFHQNRHDEAESTFRKALMTAPDVPIYRTKLALALVRNEIPIRPTRTGRLSLMPRWRRRLSDERKPIVSPEREPQLAEAEELCKDALRFDPDFTEAFGCLGTIASIRGKFRESEDYLRAAIRIDQKAGNPSDLRYSELGALYIQMGRYDEAEKNLKRAIAIDRDNLRAHIELGNLYLQIEKDKDAVQEFRQALAIDPNEEDPPRALAIALMQTGEFGEAEWILRNAIRRLDRTKRWQLHLTLCRLLTSLGEETDEQYYFEEALEEVSEAIKLKSDHPDPYLYRGIVKSKLEDYRGALRAFQRCLQEDPDNFEAERYARQVRHLHKETKIQRGSFIGGLIIGILATILVSTLWISYFAMSKGTETMLTVMTPILLGLIVVAFLLPSLIRLKLPGLEADLSQPKESISSGPKGDIRFSSSPSYTRQGPR